MNLTIHRGAREIGGTCVELSTEGSRILIDFGIPLATNLGAEFDESKLKGESVASLIKKTILPSVEGLYKAEKPTIDAVLISHSHKDHYGFLTYINPEIPVCISEGSKKLIDVSNIFTYAERRIPIVRFQPVHDGIPFKIKNFSITPYLVDHSGFDAMAYHIKDTISGKSIFYSGDFRATGWKKGLFYRLVRKPPKAVDYLLMEGTTIDKEDGLYKEEEDVLNRTIEILEQSDNNIVFACAAGQNIDRLITFYKACWRTDSLFVIDPYIASILYAIKTPENTIQQFNWENVRVFIANYRNRHGKHIGDRYIKLMKDSAYKSLIPRFGKVKIKPRDFGALDKKALVLIRSSMVDVLRDIPGINDSALIYSQWEGYLKREDRSTNNFLRFIKDFNLKMELVHTSGHATVDKLKILAKSIKPKKKIIPIHTLSPEKFIHYFGSKAMLLPNGRILQI
ncbi:MAG: MBL fold metallo-hydrolase [Candidatus Omnitrophica bacterium]|nr:MBL fold metallo-hydrolase [Candidatus Omnitrophota bacterium]